jgi:predicted anti-sigma-YlaC factor YlaD
MNDDPRSEFLDRLEAAIARATRRERLSARWLTVLLLVTVLCMGAWSIQSALQAGPVGIFDHHVVIGLSSEFSVAFGLDWLPQLLPWVVALCYGVLGAAALLHFAVFRRQAQQLRRQKCLTLLVELEDAVRRRAVKSP